MKKKLTNYKNFESKFKTLIKYLNNIRRINI